MPVLAVVIPSRNRPEGLAALLGTLTAQAAGLEVTVAVVVCDDGSSPAARLPEVVPAGTRLLRHDAPRGPAAARNTAWHAVEAPWIWFLDDDVTPEPGALAAVLAAISTLPPDVGIVEGPIRCGTGPGAARPHPLSPRLPDGGPAHRMTASIVYRRAALAAVGGFDESFAHAACEDFDLAFRVEDARWSHRFVEAAAVRHPVHPPLAPGAWFARQRRRRAAAVRLYTRHARRFDPSWMGAAARLVGGPGAPLTPSTWLRFFVLEAIFEAWAGRPGWWNVWQLALTGVATVGVAAGVVRDYVAGVFSRSRYIT